MVRRNIFQPPPPPEEPAAPASESTQRFPNTGAMSGIRSTLKDLSTNAVREIVPEMIDDDGPKDRLRISDEDVAQLAESIRAHGQQVPIMVRPIADRPGYYRIVYGRRRLHALRLLGRPAKALVRSLSDHEAILAQGQENAERLDPSFIEKALFAAELADVGYESSVIQDALAIDKAMLSRMNKVARTIPPGVIQLVGSAHGIGRRRWEELADVTRHHGLDLIALAEQADVSAIEKSDDRFARLSTAANAATRPERSAPAPSAAQQLTLEDGTVVCELIDTARGLTLKLQKSAAPAFADWLRDNANDALRKLHDEWQATQASQTSATNKGAR
ncbi:plasmid partitioning protein RepB [Pararhodobacter marinus]|uniref:plasmid partitioning protein RepB n=1 Tax=Pararhodobacter marinus TaxID=2184063 RepID=UPI003511E7AC